MTYLSAGFFLSIRNGNYTFNNNEFLLTENGVERVNGNTAILDADINLVLTFTNSQSVDRVGASFASTAMFNGQIYNLRLTDLTTPSNSRFYPGLITSATRPTTTTLVDELSGENGTLTNFPASMEWTEVETGGARGSDGSEKRFKRIPQQRRFSHVRP